MDEHESEHLELEEELEIMTAAELMDGEVVPEQKTLLGDLWRVGELSVMFGDTGSGKSLFAVQIADAVASGNYIPPFELTAGAQKVLLLDLGQTGEQFKRRYTSEPDPDTGEVRRCEFPSNLIHVSLKSEVQMSVMKLAPIIERTGAKVVIIDSLAFLQKYALPRETVVVMRELRRLQKRYGLSILVVMNTARVVHRRGIVATDIQCASVVTSFADNIFALGRSGSRSNVRYLKHIKNCLEDTLYSAAHVPYFRIVRQDGNFPSMHFVGYASEMAVREEDDANWEWERLRSIKKFYAAKKSLKAVADEFGVSRTTAFRLLKIAASAPPPPTPAAVVGERVKQFYDIEKCIVEGCYNCWNCKGRSARNRNQRGSLRGHDDCPDDCDLCGPRRYPPTAAVDPTLRKLSDNHYMQLRDWLLNNKKGPRPVYFASRRYGIEEACWRPGSENWTPDQLAIYNKWVRNGQQGAEPDVNGSRAGP